VSPAPLALTRSTHTQFSVKHEQKLDCGGGYIKLLPKSSCVPALKGPPVRDACGCFTSLTRVCPALVFVQQAGGLWR
jgi:hypothetical protein